MIYEKRNVKYTCGRGHRLVDWAHVHHEFEVVYAEQEGAAAICDGVEYTLNKGDLFFSFPHTIHSYRMINERASHILMVFSPDDFPAFTKALLNSRPASPVIKGCSPTVQELIAKLISVNGSEYEEQKIFAYMSLLLCEIMPRFDLVERTQTESNNLKRLLEYCGENFTKDISLQSISAELYMNKYHVSHLFNDVLGISLRKYINTMRIKMAERLLAHNEMSVNEISCAVGFTTQRTFNRVFYEYKGITPSEFRQKKLQKAKEKSQ